MFVELESMEEYLELAPEILAGFFLLTVLGLFMGKYLDWVVKKIDTNPPEGFTEDTWKELIKPKEGRTGFVIGVCERTLFFILILTGGAQLIPFWLGFKVASKWEVWQNIVKVPDKDVIPSGLTFEARKAFGGRVLQRFLIGTLMNLLLSGLAVVFVFVIDNLTSS
jgi:hypothetical protein